MIEQLLPYLDNSVALVVLAVINYLLWQQNTSKDAQIIELHKSSITILEKLHNALDDVLKNDDKLLEHFKELQQEVFKVLTTIKERIK